MTREECKNETKRRILRACVKLFMAQGYYKTTLTEIVKEAKVSFSSFQNIFHTKSGVLLELTKLMFSSQFSAAKSAAIGSLSPVCVYAAETAIQMTITELNDNLREIYVEAYSDAESLEFIFENTSAELMKIFSPYNPDWSAEDFYEFDVGSAGIMRGYMAKKSNSNFTAEKKLERFITMSLRSYNVPKNEIDEALAFVFSLDIKEISKRVMHELFEFLALELYLDINEIEMI